MLFAYGGKSPQIDPTAYVSDSAELIGDVVVGPCCYIGPKAIIRADAAKIVLEEGVAVEDGVIIHAGGKNGECRVCRRVTIGHGAIVHAAYLGPEASIGMGAVLSVGCSIGEGTIIGECALIPQGRTVGNNLLMAGVPAKVLRPLSDKDIKTWQANKEWYIKLTASYLDSENFYCI